MFDSLIRFSRNNAMTLSVGTLSVALFFLYKNDYLSLKPWKKSLKDDKNKESKN